MTFLAETIDGRRGTKSHRSKCEARVKPLRKRQNDRKEKTYYNVFMKKILLILSIMLLLPAFATQKIYLEALEDFNSANPSKTFSAKVLETSVIEGKVLFEQDKINCVFDKKKEAKRAKIDAKIFFQIESYENKNGVHKFNQNISAKYAQNVLNKETIKRNVTPKKAVKTAASVAGGAIVEGGKYIVSFAEGIIENEEGNRLKSGAKQVYDDSFLSYVEYGDEIDIKIGDKFYFIIK